MAEVDNAHEKFFSVIITAITVISVVKVCAKNIKIQILISICIEIGEILAYCFVFNGILYNVQNSESFFQGYLMVIVIGLLGAVEVIILVLSESPEDNNTCSERLNNVFIELISFILRNLAPIISLFHFQLTSYSDNICTEMLIIICFFLQTEVASFFPLFDYAVRTYHDKSFRLQIKILCCQKSVGK